MASYKSWDKKKNDPFWFLNDNDTPVKPPIQPPTQPPTVTPTQPPTVPPTKPPKGPETQPPLEHVEQLYALIIGIDTYDRSTSDFDPLHGAAADADDIEQLCISTFRVPRERIKNLRDQEATRANIINAIKDLGDNPAIQSNDPILIFYAGHGTQASAPEGWPAKGQIQMIVPYNFVKKSTRESSLETQGILDLELARLLNDVARKKSNNITVIMDCCHSGSGTRAERMKGIRRIDLPKDYAISQALINQVMTSTRGSGVAKGFDRKGLASHILLAACKETEESQEKTVEVGKRGAFTSALTQLLREQAEKRLTYTDVILRLPMIKGDLDRVQCPQVEGVHQYRVLFDGRIPSPRSQIIEVSGTTAKGKFKLYAGEAEGVLVDSVFAVYNNRDLEGDPVGHIQPIRVDGTSSTLCKVQPGTDTFSLFSKLGFAIQVESGSSFKARLLLNLNSEQEAIFKQAQKEMQTNYAGSRQVEFVDSRNDKPELVVSAKGQFAVFEITDPVCQRNGLKEIYYKNMVINYDNALRVLRAIADFFFHLRRIGSNKEDFDHLSVNVNIECHKLTYTNLRLPGYLKKVLMPEEGAGSVIREDGEMHVKSSGSTNYGFTITSEFKDTGLYAALFFFDMSKLSIAPYYLPILAKRDKRVTAERVHSIPPKGKALTVGYGESGTQPRYFVVNEGQDVDVGYLRLFVSTDYADWTKIEQTTPFDETRGDGTTKVEMATNGWGAKTIPVIITKGEEEDEDEGEIRSDVEDE